MTNYSISSSDSARAPLGNIAKFASAPPPQVQDAVLMRFYLQTLSRELLPAERVAKCLRAIVPTKHEVEVVYDAEKHTAHYRNLITCARLWFCPVCATRITELRAAELLKAVTKWHEEGGFVALLTFTLRHHAGDELEALLTAIRNAHRRFKAGRSWYTFSEDYNWHGSVTALEVTHGDNGWHPHLHELVFFEPLASNQWRTFQETSKRRWQAVLAAEGKDATWEHGLDVRDAESDVYDYVAKFGRLPAGTNWTLEREVVKAPIKKAHKDGRTPFQLLLDYGNGDLKAGRLFQEYARTFKGRKQLFWSRGLRAELGLNDEPSDEDLLQEVSNEYELLATFTRLQWKAILGLERDVRGELLAIASTGDKTALLAFLEHCGVSLEVGI